MYIPLGKLMLRLLGSLETLRLFLGLPLFFSSRLAAVDHAIRNTRFRLQQHQQQEHTPRVRSAQVNVNTHTL